MLHTCICVYQAFVRSTGFGKSFIANNIVSDGAILFGVNFSPANYLVSLQNLHFFLFMTMPTWACRNR